MKENMSMELMWIEQAISSRKQVCIENGKL